MIRVLSKGIESNNLGAICAIRSSILVGLIVLVFGGCEFRQVKFENATEAVKSLDKHKIIGCGDMNYISAGATSGLSCKIEGRSKGFEIYTYERDAYDSCNWLDWCSRYLEESDGKCCRFIGNVQIITYYHSDAGMELGDTLAADLVD